MSSHNPSFPRIFSFHVKINDKFLQCLVVFIYKKLIKFDLYFVCYFYEHCVIL